MPEIIAIQFNMLTAIYVINFNVLIVKFLKIGYYFTSWCKKDYSASCVLMKGMRYPLGPEGPAA